MNIVSRRTSDDGICLENTKTHDFVGVAFSLKNSRKSMADEAESRYVQCFAYLKKKETVCH